MSLFSSSIIVSEDGFLSYERGKKDFVPLGFTPAELLEYVKGMGEADNKVISPQTGVIDGVKWQITRDRYQITDGMRIYVLFKRDLERLASESQGAGPPKKEIPSEIKLIKPVGGLLRIDRVPDGYLAKFKFGPDGSEVIIRLNWQQFKNSINMRTLYMSGGLQGLGIDHQIDRDDRTIVFTHPSFRGEVIVDAEEMGRLISSI